MNNESIASFNIDLVPIIIYQMTGPARLASGETF